MMPMSYVNAGLEQLVVVVQHANSASQRKGQMLTDKKIANAVASLRARLARTVGYNEGKSRANATKHVDACAKTKRRKYFIGAYQDFMRREGDSKGWSKSSREKYNSMWNHITKMERMKGNGFCLSFDFFRERGLTEYFCVASSAGHSNTNITPSTTSSISHLSSASHKMSQLVLQRRSCTSSSTSAYRLRSHPSSV